MEPRRDALAAAAEMVVHMEALARDTPGLVATVGDITVVPGAPNVIAGRAELVLDVRHPEDTDRIWTVGPAEGACGRDRVGSRDRVGLGDAARAGREVRCDPGLTGRMFQALEDVGVQPNRSSAEPGTTPPRWPRSLR